MHEAAPRHRHSLQAVFQRGLGLHYLVAQALTTILLIPPGYVIHRRWVFR